MQNGAPGAELTQEQVFSCVHTTEKHERVFNIGSLVEMCITVLQRLAVQSGHPLFKQQYVRSLCLPASVSPLSFVFN